MIGVANVRSRSLIAILHELWRAPPRGVALVEFGLVLPFLVILLVFVVDLGLAFYAALQVQGAASAGAQYASLHAFNATNIANVVQNVSTIKGITASPAPTEVCLCIDSNNTFSSGGTYNPNAIPPASVCSGTCSSGDSPGIYAQVNAQLSYSMLISYPGLVNPLTLTGVAYRRIQ